jgi:CMP-N-acetylneuraminic acid synthetase
VSERYFPPELDRYAECVAAMPSRPRVLAIIPARGGSKGLARKNARLLCGKPLVSYSVEVAQRSRLIDRVVVTTDDDEIAEIAASHGQDVALRRPAELGGDRAGIGEVIAHARASLAREGYFPEYIVTLLPTHPFRTPGLVDRLTAIGLMEGRRVLTVRRMRRNALSHFFLSDGRLLPVEGGCAGEWFRPYGIFVGEHLGLPDRLYLHVVEDERELVDIDYLEDFLLAEHIVKNGMFDFHAA